MKLKKVYVIIFSIIVFFSFSYLLFNEISFKSILKNIGGYRLIVIPIISIFGNNLFTSSFLYPILFFLKSEGTNLFLLSGLVTIGATIGDLVLVVFGREINHQPKEKIRKKIFHFFQENKNSTYLRVFIFLYAAFFPMSNEFMTFALGYFKYPPRKIFLPLILGNFVYFTILIWFGGTIFNKIL